MTLTSTQAFARRKLSQSALITELLEIGFVLVVFLYFVLPANILLLAHWHYLGGGPEFQKIHPATYCLVSVLGLMLALDVRFRTAAIALCCTEWSLIFFAVSVAATALFAIAFRHLSIAPFVDTFAAALITTVGCICLSTRYLRLLRYLINAYFIASIAMVLFEYFTKRTIIDPGPYGYYGEYFRARALFEGPLSAATLLGLYSLVSLVSTRVSLSLPCVSRLFLSFASFCAVFTTGGRTSLVAAALIAVGVLFVVATRDLLRGYVNKAGLFYAIVAVPTVFFCLAILLRLGLFDTIIERFRNDIGSALSRQVALELMLNMSASQLWFGLSARDVLNLVWVQAEYGLIAIEISWVNFVLVCGLVFTVPLFVSYILFLFRFLWKYCGLAVWAPSLFLLVNTSASNGIWTKTTLLTTSLTIMISLLRKYSLEVVAREQWANRLIATRFLQT